MRADVEAYEAAMEAAFPIPRWRCSICVGSSDCACFAAALILQPVRFEYGPDHMADRCCARVAKHIRRAGRMRVEFRLRLRLRRCGIPSEGAAPVSGGFWHAAERRVPWSDNRL